MPKTICKRGHPLTGDNVRLNAKGHKQCKACAVMRNKLARVGKYKPQKRWDVRYVLVVQVRDPWGDVVPSTVGDEYQSAREAVRPARIAARHWGRVTVEKWTDVGNGDECVVGTFEEK